MLPRDLIKHVKRLEIIAKRAVHDQLAGQYQSVFKGRGMDFVDVRPYQPGDDIRVIDWNVSARTDELHIKQFVEERELTVFLLVDASGSQLFGTQNQRKQEAAAELGALLAFSAISNNDRVGLMTFTDRVETFIPPKKGRKHVLRVITEILDQSPDGRGTDIHTALEYLARIQRKKAVVFLLSDFLDDSFERALHIATKRHELVPVVITDPMEEQLPNLGLVRIEDPESGEVFTVDTTSRKIRRAFEEAARGKREAREKLFRRLKIDFVNVRTDADHIAPLIKYFRLRSRRA
ncbi:MAG: DUF58 domain-containing protein [Myxococcota bacterium]